MTPLGFVVAMDGLCQSGEAARPWQATMAGPCWLVVCRWGVHGEFLSVGLSGAAGQTPDRTLLGVLGPTAPCGGDAAFVLQGRQPRDVTLAGRFTPASGVAWLVPRGGTLALCLLCRVGRGGSWRIDASRVPWLGEVIDPA